MKTSRFTPSTLVLRLAETALALVLATFAATTQAGVFSIAGAAGMLADANPVGLPNTISLTTAETGIIADLNVSIELVPGPNAFLGNDLPWDDLDILISHNGVTVSLHESQTSAGPNSDVLFDVTFDDEAGTTLVDLIFAAPFPPLPNALGSFAPDGGGALSDFDGMSLAGTWDLTFIENCCSEETILNSWSISGMTAVPAPGGLMLLVIGLIGLRARGHRNTIGH